LKNVSSTPTLLRSVAVTASGFIIGGRPVKNKARKSTSTQRIHPQFYALVTTAAYTVPNIA